MNNFLRIFLFLFLTTISTNKASAQFSLQQEIDPGVIMKLADEKIKQQPEVENNYFSKARWQAERRRIRNERNTIEFKSMLAISQTQFENWSAGGQNTFSTRATLFARHQYKREKFTLDYQFNARYGINMIDGQRFKNEDEFKFNIKTLWAINQNWSYAGTVNIRSQFSEGFKSLTDNTKVSNFLSPAYYDISGGIDYRKANSPVSVTISPVTGSFRTIKDDDLSAVGTAGVPAGEKFLGQLGPSLNVTYNDSFFKDIVKVRSTFNCFQDLTKSGNMPRVRMETNVDIKATDFLTTSLYLNLYYDELSKAPKPKSIQYTYVLSLGFTYDYKNK